MDDYDSKEPAVTRHLSVVAPEPVVEPPAGRYPASRAAGTGRIDRVGNLHDQTGRFQGRQLREGEPEVINASDGSFYFPPRFDKATAEEYIDFWLTVPVPDEAIARFVSAHRAVRATDPDAGDDYPKVIPFTWARTYARWAMIAGLARNLPESERDKVWNHHVEVDYDPKGDTAANLFNRYRMHLSARALHHADMPGGPQANPIAEIKAKLDQLAEGLNRVEETVDRVEDELTEVKGEISDIEEITSTINSRTDLIDRTVAPPGTY